MWSDRVTLCSQRVKAKAKDAGLRVYVVQDAGRTQVPAGSKTVLAIIGPKSKLSPVISDLKLM